MAARGLQFADSTATERRGYKGRRTEPSTGEEGVHQACHSAKRTRIAERQFLIQSDMRAGVTTGTHKKWIGFVFRKQAWCDMTKAGWSPRLQRERIMAFAAAVQAGIFLKSPQVLFTFHVRVLWIADRKFRAVYVSTRRRRERREIRRQWRCCNWLRKPNPENIRGGKPSKRRRRASRPAPKYFGVKCQKSE